MELYMYVMLVLLWPLCTHQEGGCPPEFLPLLGHCYKMLAGAFTGVDAVSQCQSLGAQITSSKTEAENALLLDLRSNASRGGERLWLGLNDSAVGNEWRWMDDNSLVDTYPTSHHWRSISKSEIPPVNNLQCAWITGDNRQRLWSHTKCSNHPAITVCKTYLAANTDSVIDKTTSMKNELSTVQDMLTMGLSMPTSTVNYESASSSKLEGILSSHISSTPTQLFMFTATTTLQSPLFAEEDDVSSDKLITFMSLATPSQTITNNPVTTPSQPLATTSTVSTVPVPSSALDLAADVSTSTEPILIRTETPQLSTLSHPTRHTQVSIQTLSQISMDSHTQTQIKTTHTQASVTIITSTSIASQNCLCHCKSILLPEVLVSLQEKYSALVLETSALSSYVRKKMSIPDYRVSSNCIGVSGLLVCFVPLLIVFFADLMTCLKGR
ncbi:platelet glycoprotein Ib alpha chain-like [Haliotis cracherodii]|uniref:platelet glycoprotein Ib alpha chain-like n=1 Tax=Haliotis cracherodii TaxID=6455 RepID=UPI0039E991A8